jgi:hypothetical protein
MSKSRVSFQQAQERLVNALHDYQVATLEMSLAMQRLSGHTQAFYTPLKKVLVTSGAMITPRGNDH